MVSHYRRGRRKEYELMKELKDMGYTVIRSSKSNSTGFWLL